MMMIYVLSTIITSTVYRAYELCTNLLRIYNYMLAGGHLRRASLHLRRHLRRAVLDGACGWRSPAAPAAGRLRQRLRRAGEPTYRTAAAGEPTYRTAVGGAFGGRVRWRRRDSLPAVAAAAGGRGLGEAGARAWRGGRAAAAVGLSGVVSPILHSAYFHSQFLRVQPLGPRDAVCTRHEVQLQRTGRQCCTQASLAICAGDGNALHHGCPMALCEVRDAARAGTGACCHPRQDPARGPVPPPHAGPHGKTH